MSDLRLSEVAVAYNGTTVINGVDVDVPARSWVALIGPNGAGKTTLLRAVAGLVGYSGTIEIGGRPALGMSRRRLSQLVAFLPQRPIMPEGVSVADYVSIGRTPYIPYWGTESAEDRAVVHEVLERLELAALAHRHIESLSGGESQRAVLARALAQRSEILLLDEPTSALDVGHQQQVMELIDDLRVEQGLTVLTALHDLTLAGQFASRLVLLDRGLVVSEGRAREVLTEERIQQHYAATVRVVDEPGAGLTVIPVRSLSPTSQAAVPQEERTQSWR
ncbi:MAG TPA: ABC transporter ATP-binding protein [Acidimicrobiia bacterium]|nr:ABC transporter ATP-binding protein [Acidimicrobiia bacterium]